MFEARMKTIKVAPTNIERRTYSVPEAAAVAGVGTSIIYKMIKLGSIPHVRMGKNLFIPKAAYHEYLDNGSISAKE